MAVSALAESTRCPATESEVAVVESDFRDDSKREQPLSAATVANASTSLVMSCAPSRQSPRRATGESHGAGKFCFDLNRCQYGASADPHRTILVGGIAHDHRRLAVEISEQRVACTFDPDAERQRQLDVPQH